MTVLITLIMVLPIASMGATIVVTDSVSGLTDHYGTLTVPQFDGMYPLNSITIEATGWLDGFLGYENTNLTASGGFNLVSNDFDGWLYLGGEHGEGFQAPVTGGDLLFEYHDAGDPSGAVFVGAFDGIVDYAGTSGASLPYGTSNPFSMTLTPDNPLVASFYGDGTVDFSVLGWIWTSVTIYGADNSWELSTTAGWDITVTYDFDTAVAIEASTFGSVKALFR